MMKYKPVKRSAPFYFARIKKTSGIFEKWLVKHINTANLSDYRLISISVSNINPLVDRQDIWWQGMNMFIEKQQGNSQGSILRKRALEIIPYLVKFY
jgi:hypothetical protein